MATTIFIQTIYYEIIISHLFLEDFLNEINMANGKLNTIRTDVI